MRTDRVRVSLGKRSYDVLVGTGLLGRLGDEVGRLSLGRSVLIVTDPMVGNLYLDEAERSLKKAGLRTEDLVIPRGEKGKTIRALSRGYDAAVSLDRGDGIFILTLGGGAVGDLGGLIAATYRRGVPFVQCPTTILAQVDASVGGKTAVNHPRAKNMIGVFHQPSLVVSDLATLRSLPRREISSGLAEVVKHGILGDPDLFRLTIERGGDLLGLDYTAVREAVTSSVVIKSGVVSRDERETRGIREILNLGHTTAHAIEAVAGFGRYRHGEAVGMGLATASRIGEDLIGTPVSLTERIIEALEGLRLPVRMKGLRASDLVKASRLDKKSRTGRLRMTLPRRLGSCRVIDGVPVSLFRKVLREFGA